MTSRIKFNNVDVLAFMEQVVSRHTQYYQSDFEIDKEHLFEAADRREKPEKTFIWLCRTHGTWLLSERNVFLKDTRENHTFRFYMEQTREPVLAFVIEAEYSTADIVIGNVYVLDYRSYYNHVCSVSLHAETAILQYENGFRTRKADDNIYGYPDMEYGKLQSVQYQPHSPEELTGVLRKEQQERRRFKEGNPSAYIAML